MARPVKSYRLEMVGSIPSSTDSTLVELTVDRYGHVRDWNMVRGELTPDVKSVILFSTSIPAPISAFQPTAKFWCRCIPSPARPELTVPRGAATAGPTFSDQGLRPGAHRQGRVSGSAADRD
jgi:hypothetical protein